MGKLKTYKIISHKKWTLRAILLKNTCRKGISRIARLKTGYSILKGHKTSEIDTETSPEYYTCKVKKTPEHFLLNYKEYDTEWAKLDKDIKEIFYKINCHKLSITMDDLLGEFDLPSQDAVIVREKVEDFILATGKEISNQKKNRLIRFMYLFVFILFYFYFIKTYSFVWIYLSINQEFKLFAPWGLFMYNGKMYDSYATEITCHIRSSFLSSCKLIQML